MLKHILCTGGGTLGSVTPLLALIEASREQHLSYRFSWIGTNDGPEKHVVESSDVPYIAITSERWRRFIDYRNALAPIRNLRGYREALKALRADQPELVLAAGAFVSVPVVYAARRLRIPVVLYEMDLRRGLANILMAPVSTKRLSLLPRAGTEVIGALVRPSLRRGSESHARSHFQVPANQPLILVTGGGTGAQGLNVLLQGALPRITEHATVIHLTGKGKMTDAIEGPHYIPLEFAGPDMASLLAAATVVVSRGGMGTISELAVLKKAAIIVPIPNSHQEDNAEYIAGRGAAVLFDQRRSSSEFATVVLDLLANAERRTALASSFHALLPDGTSAALGKIATLLTPSYG